MADTLSIVDNRTGKKYELPIQDSTIRSSYVGVYMDQGTTGTTVRRVTFIGETRAAIVDYLGVNNSYSGNDYSGLAAGAVPVSTAH